MRIEKKKIKNTRPVSQGADSELQKNTQKTVKSNKVANTARTQDSEKLNDYREKTNRVRRNQYKNNPEYSQMARLRSKRTYNKRRKEKNTDERPWPIIDPDELGKFGKKRTLMSTECIESVDSLGEEVTTFTVRELHHVAGGYKRYAFYRWIKKGMFPVSTSWAVEKKPKVDGTMMHINKEIYTLEEMIQINLVMWQHRKNANSSTLEDFETNNYRSDHHATKNRMRRDIAAIRGDTVNYK